MKVKINKVTLQISDADILSLAVDGFVNSTDPNLNLSPILLAKAGQSVQEACKAIGWCDIGEAVITPAGNLPHHYIIHVVGPKWGEGSERGKLANATLACLRLAEKSRLRSLSFPAISAGVLGYPLENCARTMIAQIIDYTFESPRYLKNISICLDNQTAYLVFKSELNNQIDELRKAGDGEVSV